MFASFSRRRFVQAVTAATLATGLQPGIGRTQDSAPLFSYPMGLPGRALGDGAQIRIGYACENTPYYPGWWHTGENWDLIAGDTTAAGVYAAAAGRVVFAGYDYPGPVVIIRHAADCYSMYGHLAYDLAVAEGQTVDRGQLVGRPLAWPGDVTRSHLHFELRTFLTRPEINGDAPQYGVHCGYECPPGPGYWPMTAPQHPSALGWRNPTHVINRRAWPSGVPDGVSVVVAAGAPESTALWTAPADTPGAEQVADLPLVAGNRSLLLGVDAGAEDATGTSAEAYRLWYRIALPDGSDGWVQAAVPLALETGSDGRPSSVRLDFLPEVATPA
jgi:murein DD-endopeptidase MepM/ murein hydrolase activator NlpD